MAIKKIIVTGGCGYIGSHVARAFKMNGDEVFIIDRVLREHTLKDIDGWFIDDFASEASLSTIIDMNPDVIVHCAGTSLVGPSMENPSEYYNNNVVKTITMLDVLKDLPKKPLIMFSSSASVYGEPTELPIRESATIQPMSPYGNSKAMVEVALKDFWYAYGVPSLVFRYFNAAGAMPGTADLGQEPGATHIIARILEAALARAQFIINGDTFDTLDGTCVRDYVHVWDIALAHVKGAEFMLGVSGHHTSLTKHVASTPCTIYPRRFRTYNLGTNSGISNKQIADYVLKHYNLPYVTYGNARKGDPAKLIADATEAHTELGWIPQYSEIETIINTAYKWYSRN